MIARSALAALAALTLLAGCLEYSPHQLATDDDDQDLNRKAIERILAQPGGGPISFVALGDTQRSFDEAREAVAAINARDDVQFVVQIGDFTNVGIWFEFREMKEIFDELRVPYLVVVGNHDWFGNGGAIYESMFGPTNFTFTHRRVKFVVYDSNSVSHDFDGTVPDVAWVAREVAPGPDHDRVLALAHVAPGQGSLFDERLTAPLLAALAAGGVDFSLNAHAHRFDSYEQDGVRILIADSAEHRSFLVVSQGEGGRFGFEKVDF